jgi:hypothetical protein
MGRNNSFLRVLLTALAAFTLSSTNAYSQATSKSLEITQNQRQKDSGQRIKWTRQLPAAVRKAFENSKYSSWYIEKMISHRRDEQTVYQFYIDNSSLLDGDHHESMAIKKTLTVSDKGVIVQENDCN